MWVDEHRSEPMSRKPRYEAGVRQVSEEQRRPQRSLKAMSAVVESGENAR